MKILVCIWVCYHSNFWGIVTRKSEASFAIFFSPSSLATGGSQFTLIISDYQKRYYGLNNTKMKYLGLNLIAVACNFCKNKETERLVFLWTVLVMLKSVLFYSDFLQWLFYNGCEKAQKYASVHLFRRHCPKSLLAFFVQSGKLAYTGSTLRLCSDGLFVTFWNSFDAPPFGNNHVAGTMVTF